MSRIIYFFKDISNLIFTATTVFVLLDIKFNFFTKHTEVFVQSDFDIFLNYFGVTVWAIAFISLIVLSTKSYNNKDK